MATAYHSIDMPVNMIGSGGVGGGISGGCDGASMPLHALNGHNRHHPNGDNLFVGTAIADDSSVFYDSPPQLDHQRHIQHQQHVDHLQPDYYAAEAFPLGGDIYATNDHPHPQQQQQQHSHPHQPQPHPLMSAEDGFWGCSPCSSDSTNGRDYSPSIDGGGPPTSATASTSPYQPSASHQYAPVYYADQYERPANQMAANDAYELNAAYYNATSCSTAASESCPPTLAGGSNACPTAAAAAPTTGTDGILAVPFVRVVKRRTTANKKERRRTQSINSAFTYLRDCIPNVPSDTKLSKIKTLRLATSYISYLTRVLEGDQDPSGGFRAELVPSSRKINAERRAKYEAQGLTLEDIGALCLSSSNNSCASESPSNKKAKGRTGWPQHVWASELKQEQ